MSHFNKQLEDKIREHYFAVFRYYNKKDLSHLFTNRWLQVVQTYSELEHFIAFDPVIPILTRLVNHAKGVILVPFTNTKFNKIPPFASIFPYYPFRVKGKYKDTLCTVGLEFLHLYLNITDIRFICLYQLHYQHTKIAKELRKEHPNLKIYMQSSYKSFCQIMSKLSLNSSKSQFHSSYLKDKISQSEVL